MAGQNRSSYARSNSGANRGLIAFFRGAFILLVALTLSFGLGFFVIARMLPATANDPAGSNSVGGGPTGGTSTTSHRERPSQRSDRPAASTQVSSRPAPPAQDGPELLPDNNVQEPDKLGTSGGNSGANSPAEPNASNLKARAGAQADNAAARGTDPAEEADSGDSTGTRRSRRSRSSVADSGAVQQAGSPDPPRVQPVEPSEDRPSTTSPPAKSGLYRVQIGVYSTREKAEEMVRSAADKGITTSLHVITRDGRTLYRVQQSSHRDRTKAEVDRQKLQDAGFDATIINPS